MISIIHQKRQENKNHRNELIYQSSFIPNWTHKSTAGKQIKPYYNKGVYVSNILPRIPYIVDLPEKFKLKEADAENVEKIT